MLSARVVMKALRIHSVDRRQFVPRHFGTPVLSRSGRRFVVSIRVFSLVCVFLYTLGFRTAIAQQTSVEPPNHYIEFEATEVTKPDITVSPDGQWLVFTMLGHLFQLPTEGGVATQLTFGPHFDGEPAVSPDGSKIAFVSDRNGEDRNIFVLELQTGEITQVTHESLVSRPAWRPDGEGIVYLRMEGLRQRCPNNLSVVRQVALMEDEPKTITDLPLPIRSLFYLPDGRLAWTVYEGDPHEGQGSTRIEVRSAGGGTSTLRSLQGMWNNVVPSPRGDGFYGTARRYLPHHGFFGQPTDLLFNSDSEDAVQHLATVGSPYCFPEDAILAVPQNGEALYVGEGGHLLKIPLPAGPPERVAFSAKPKVQIHPPVAPPAMALADPGGALRPQSVLDPQLSPDGSTLVFVALGYIWQQSLTSGNARRLLEGNGFERDPTFSPDGTQLAYVHSEYGTKEVRVLDLASGQVRTLHSASSLGLLSWSPDGKKLVVGGKRGGRFRVLALDVSEGGDEILASASPRYWLPRPHFSVDGGTIYYTDDSTGTPLLYRLPLEKGSEATPVTEPLDQFEEGLVAPDGRQLVYRRNNEIWVVPLSSGPPSASDARRVSAEGGDSFSFTLDGSAVIYSAGDRVWRHPLAGGPREEIPIQLALDVPEPPPLLMKRVRVLDSSTGSFGSESSVFIQGGRLQWIGTEDGREIPNDTKIVDGDGGFAIPGLFDMHVHVESGWQGSDVSQQAFMAYGVTSVRDMGERLPWVESLADRARTPAAVPRYFYPGNAFESSQPGRGGWGLGILREDEAREYVRRWKERGVHFIKTHPPISWEVRRAVVDEARRLGLPVAGHGAIIEELVESVRWGHAFIEHAGGPGGRVYDDVLQLLAIAGTRWDPTLMNMGVGIVWAREEPERWDDPKLSAFVPEDVRRVVKSVWGAVDVKALRGLWFEQLAQIREAYRRGVKLHVGTDAQFWQMVYPGSSLHMEMELFAQAGLTPFEVLRLTTIEAATALGVQDDLGTLEVGKLADIVLLDRNPLLDIKNTQAIQLVIKDGWVFDPTELTRSRN